VVVKRGDRCRTTELSRTVVDSCMLLLSVVRCLLSVVCCVLGARRSVLNQHNVAIDRLLALAAIPVACISVRISHARLNCADPRRPPDHTTFPDRGRRVQFPADGMK
jgi:hypothetical protein